MDVGQTVNLSFFGINFVRFKAVGFWQRGRIGKCTGLENQRPIGHVRSRLTAVVILLVEKDGE